MFTAPRRIEGRFITAETMPGGNTHEYQCVTWVQALEIISDMEDKESEVVYPRYRNIFEMFTNIPKGFVVDAEIPF